MYVNEFDYMLKMFGQARTYITSEFIEDGTIDLDVNEDGVVDIKDAACFAVYYRNTYPVYYVLNEDGDYVSTKITKRIDLPDKIDKKIKKYCDAATPERNQHSTYTHDDDRCLEIIEYFVMHYPLKECYFEDEYYDTLLSTDTSQYGLGEILTFRAKNRQVIIPRGNTERFQFYQDVFEEQFTAYYQNVLDGKQPILYANTLAGTNELRIYVCGNDEQTTVTALFDNLGKGASGAAVQNMNIVLGIDETTGLI